MGSERDGKGAVAKGRKKSKKRGVVFRRLGRNEKKRENLFAPNSKLAGVLPKPNQHPLPREKMYGVQFALIERRFRGWRPGGNAYEGVEGIALKDDAVEKNNSRRVGIAFLFLCSLSLSKNRHHQHPIRTHHPGSKDAIEERQGRNSKQGKAKEKRNEKRQKRESEQEKEKRLVVVRGGGEGELKLKERDFFFSGLIFFAGSSREVESFERGSSSSSAFVSVPGFGFGFGFSHFLRRTRLPIGIALKYGAVPIVRNTGRLAGSVFDADRDGDRAQRAGEQVNGFSFGDASDGAVDDTLDRALGWYRGDGGD